MMNKIVLIALIAGVFTSCGNGNESSADSDTITSISPPPTSDTASEMAPMMGDTSKTEADSLQK